MFCRNCGKKLPDDSTFCGYCGTAQTPLANISSNNDGMIGESSDNMSRKEMHDNTSQSIHMQAVSSDVQTCPYCMSVIKKEAIICPNCRKVLKRNKKPFYIAGAVVAAIMVFFIISGVASMTNPVSSIRNAYNALFADIGNGTFHAEDGEYAYDAQRIVDDCIYNAAPGGYYNAFNSFNSISNNDIIRLWNVSVKNYDYTIESVEKDGDKYEVIVELSNKNIYDLLGTAFDEFEAQFDLNGFESGDILGAIVNAHEGYLDNGGGFWGTLGALAGVQESAGAAYSDKDVYLSGMDNGSNAKQVVDLFEQYVEGDNYGITNTETIRFYAAKDSNGNWCIPDVVYVETADGSFEELSYKEIFYGMLGSRY